MDAIIDYTSYAKAMSASYTFNNNTPLKNLGASAFVHNRLTIKDVIFNPPATVVFWTDNTKTVVKAQNGERFDPEKGLAMAIVKKCYGNQGNYFNKIKEWVEPYTWTESYAEYNGPDAMFAKMAAILTGVSTKTREERIFEGSTLMTAPDGAIYICKGDIRYVFRNGKYEGWYRP